MKNKKKHAAPEIGYVGSVTYPSIRYAGKYIARRPLVEIRNDVGVSQSQLATAAGVPKSAVANVEAARYALSGPEAVAIYAALARMAPAGSPVRREAKEEAAKFIAHWQDSFRKIRIAVEGRIESCNKKLQELDRDEADLKKKAAQLAEM